MAVTEESKLAQKVEEQSSEIKFTEDEIKSLPDLSSTNGNHPFFKVEPTYENEFLELKMYKQPFDVDFPNGLNVGDLILYDTTIQNCDGDNNIPKHKAEYEVVSISIE